MDCVCCNMNLDLNELILVGNVYKCALCIKNEKIAKRVDWVNYKASKLLEINNLLDELDNADILDQLVVNETINNLMSCVNDLRDFVR